MPLERKHPLSLKLGGFGNGCGATHWAPGWYGICLNGDCSDGYFRPGPREVADATGIAAAFRVVAACLHVNVWHLATTDGTDTKIYQLDTTWKVIATITSRVATYNGLVSFNSVLAVAFGSANPYQFSTNVTVNGTAYTFTASTKTAANADSANCFVAQTNGRVLPRVSYITDPNSLYFTEDLTNGDATGSTATDIGDNNSSNSYMTSIVEDDTGQLVIGTRRALWGIGAQGEPQRLTRDFEDGVTDAGGQSDRRNFEAYAEVEGRFYYIVSGNELLEYDHGDVNEYMAPKWQGRGIPRMGLPLNAIAAVGGKIVLAMGTKNTLLGVAHAPGGTSRISNSFGTTSELYLGQYIQDENGARRFTWHGIILQCTDPLRFMWYAPSTNYLYLCSGDSESVNAQQMRCLMFRDNALYHLVSTAIVLNTGTAQCEVLRIDLDLPFYLKRAKGITLDTTRLGSSSSLPSLEVEYKITGDYVADPFETDFATFITNEEAELGVDFPLRSDFRTMDVRFKAVGNGTDNTYAVLWDAEIELEAVADQPRKPQR